MFGTFFEYVLMAMISLQTPTLSVDNNAFNYIFSCSLICLTCLIIPAILIYVFGFSNEKRSNDEEFKNRWG